MSSKIKITSILVVFILILLAILPGVFAILNIDFVVNGDAESTAIEQEDPINLKYDSTNNYYYVEMGTYGGSPVRWRYVADVTNGVENATRFAPTSTNAPDTTKGKGMFILNSDIFTADTLISGYEDRNAYSLDENDGIIQFLSPDMYKYTNSKYYHKTEGYTDIYANDYAASNLRAFLTGRTNVAGQDVGNLMNVIGIDSTNAIYQKIQGRTLTDLYSSINQDGSTLTLPTQFEGSATDMFWSLSWNEALTILGGGSKFQNELIWQSPAYSEYMEWLRDSESYWNAEYWLRSPTLAFTNSASSVYHGGDVNGGIVNFSYYAVRPAFILKFSSDTVKVSYDETENYYYLEMGYHNGNPVRWRYVADVTNGVASATRFVPSSTNAPDTTKGKGMFILETCLVDSVSTITSGAASSTQDHIVTFQNSSITSGSNIYVKKSDGTASTILSNDYAASDVREFLTASNGGTNAITGQAVGSFMDLIGIDETNSIYKRIVGRTLNDLYSGIGVSNTTTFTPPTFKSVPSQFSGQTRDKFWALSADEAYRILGGNTNGGNEMPWENDAYYEYLSGIGWSSSECNAIYWLRTPGGNDYVYNISGGKIVSNWLANTNRTVRPAFVLNFDEEGTIQYDTFDNYYYMEMGSYNGSAVRWRYVADTTNGIDVATRFVPSSTNAPDMSTGRKGMFILESDIFTYNDIDNVDTTNNDGILSFLPSSMYSTSTNRHTTAGYTDVVLNDYAASNVRAFLTGRNNVAGNSVGDLMDVIGISSNNPVYKKIQGRTLSDLYSKIAVTETNNVTGFSPTSKAIPSQFSGSEVDMFWSLSINEAYRILGGNSTDANEIKWKSPTYQKRYGSSSYGWYWLRSPNPNNDYAVFYVYNQGKYDIDVINYEFISTRPAFIYQF